MLPLAFIHPPIPITLAVTLRVQVPPLSCFVPLRLALALPLEELRIHDHVHAHGVLHAALSRVCGVWDFSAAPSLAAAAPVSHRRGRCFPAQGHTKRHRFCYGLVDSPRERHQGLCERHRR
ncbi:hypothetical protein FB451DRAFT_1214356 [Mycena latifolia]|nr:hypothetical protein FB451DRAFT_1214356 [Mycena latifolia]